MKKLRIPEKQREYLKNKEDSCWYENMELNSTQAEVCLRRSSCHYSFLCSSMELVLGLQKKINYAFKFLTLNTKKTGVNPAYICRSIGVPIHIALLVLSLSGFCNPCQFPSMPENNTYYFSPESLQLNPYPASYLKTFSC